MKKYIDIIGKCALFEGIERDDIMEMLNSMKARVINTSKNQIIFSEGDPAEYMGLLISGSVRIIREDYYGNRSIVAEVEPGELFAETIAAAGAENMPVSAAASEESEIMLIDFRRMLCCEANDRGRIQNRLISNLLRVVAEKNMILNRKIEIISCRTTREKLLTYLLAEAKRRNSSEFEIPYNRQELADYLGVDRSAMSAEIARLRRDGIIESKKSRFRLLGHM